MRAPAEAAQGPGGPEAVHGGCAPTQAAGGAPRCPPGVPPPFNQAKVWPRSPFCRTLGLPTWAKRRMPNRDNALQFKGEIGFPLTIEMWMTHCQHKNPNWFFLRGVLSIKKNFRTPYKLATPQITDCQAVRWPVFRCDRVLGCCTYPPIIHRQGLHHPSGW
jgi:hypothetical protein